jgi:hypothetical protein
MAVQPFGCLLDPERASAPVTVKMEPEDKFDRFGFDGIYVEFLLDLLTAPFRFNNFVPDRRCRAIPEPLLGGTHALRMALAILRYRPRRPRTELTFWCPA